MRLQTIPDAARLLGLTTQQLRRGIQAGRYPCYEIEGRTMVDVDALGEIIEAKKRTIGIEEAAELTGLSKTMIRRGADGCPAKRSARHTASSRPGCWRPWKEERLRSQPHGR